MKLDKHVVDMFTELTKPADDVKMEKTCYGTISVVDGTSYVKLDGSDLLIPAASTVKTFHGDRVTVLMKNHSLTVTGNLTSPSAVGGGGSSGGTGTAATIEVGTVTTGEAGSSASVTNSGTTSAAVFDFVIPRGDKGEKGEKGDTGTWDGTIPDHEHTVSDITDFPTSLPANGGNADTIGAKSISQILAVKGWFDGDMDNLKEQGSYIVNDATNMPIPGGWGTALVFIGGTGSVVQVFTAYVTSASDLCKTYIRHFTGDLWSTWVNIADGGNADTLDGKHRYDFVNYLGNITDVDNVLNNPKYSDCPYEGIISSEVATSIGLPSNIDTEWSIKCFCATEGSGFQIAVPIYHNKKEPPKYRIATKVYILGSYGISWGNWNNFSDGGNAETLDGKHTSDFSQIISFGDTSTDTKTAIGIRYKTTTYWCSNWTDHPTALADGQGMIITANYNNFGATVGVDKIWCRQIFISPHPNTKIYQRILSDSDVGEWTSISDGGNADTLDGLHANEIASNPNLLINPNFAINQRGQTEYTSNGYTVDCWKTGSGFVVSVGDGLEVKPQAVLSSNLAALFQNINYDPLYDSITLSIFAEKSHDNAYMIIVALDSGGSAVGQSAKVHIEEGKVTSLTYKTIPEGTVKLRVQVTLNSGTQSSDSLRIKYAKLESGTSATRFMPPDPATELVKCQRYYVSHFVVKNGFYGTAYADRTNRARLTVALPATIRNLPTIIYTADNLALFDGANAIGITALEVHTMMGNGITLSVAAKGLTVGKSYLLLATDNTTIAYSAEL